MIQLETTKAYTIKEAAEIIHRSVPTVRNYISSGNLRAQKVGSTWYITDRTLTEFVTGEKPEVAK